MADPVPGFTGGVTLVVGDGGFFLGTLDFYYKISTPSCFSNDN